MKLHSPRLIVVAAIGSLVCFSASQAAEPAMPGTLSELMAGPVTNASNELWNAPLIEPPAGATKPVPTAEQWDSLKKNAQQLQAIGALLLKEDLPIAPAGKVANEGELTPDAVAALRKKQWDLWKAQVSTLADGAANSLKAIDSKDIDAVTAAGDVIYNVCDSCHKLFWYPEQK